MRCWHAKTDGWAASTFHSNCDGKGPTVTIVQVGSYIFGGYTEKSWGGMYQFITALRVQKCLAFSYGQAKRIKMRHVLRVSFFFKQGDKILCFQKYSNTCGLGLKPAFSLHKTPFMCEQKAEMEKKISGYV